jgi:hypothetical protein
LYFLPVKGASQTIPKKEKSKRRKKSSKPVFIAIYYSKDSFPGQFLIRICA